MRNQLRALCLLMLFGTVSAHAQFTGCLPGFCANNSFSTTFDPVTAAATLSNGNLTGTSDGTSGANQGAHVLAARGKTSGKYYYEFTGVGVIHGGNTGMGIGTTGSTYTNMGNSATTGVMTYKNGEIYANGSFIPTISPGVIGSGSVLGVAIDLTNGKIWFRGILPSLGDWNGDPSADPATNTNGQAVPAGTMIPFLTFGGLGGNAGTDTITANFGASAFSGTVPSGFTAGWP